MCGFCVAAHKDPLPRIICNMLYRAKAGKCDFRVSLESLESELSSGSLDEKFELLALSYNAFDEIDLEGEIGGNTDCFASLAAVSGNKAATVFCGITTSVMGIKHISVAVCHKGKLVDIVDRTSNPFGDEYVETQKIKVYSTAAAKIAVLVDKDVLIETNWEKTVPHCDCVLALVKGSDERVTAAALRLSEKFDIPFLYINDVSAEWKSIV